MSNPSGLFMRSGPFPRVVGEGKKVIFYDFDSHGQGGWEVIDIEPSRRKPEHFSRLIPKIILLVASSWERRPVSVSIKYGPIGPEVSHG